MTLFKGSIKFVWNANEVFLSVPNEILEQFHTSVNQIAFNRYPDPYANETITNVLSGPVITV